MVDSHPITSTRVVRALRSVVLALALGLMASRGSNDSGDKNETRTAS
jgi:hypothetical protein